MKPWTPQRPSPSKMSDHDVPRASKNLEGKRIALLVTGGIAAMKSPMIARSLRRHGAEVQAFVSKEALLYVAKTALEWATVNEVVDTLTFKAEHLSKDNPFDAYLVAPATYNTINKMSKGIADNTVTSVLASAIGFMEMGKAKILVAPTMHGDMHNSILQNSLEYLSRMGVTLIPPRDDYGKHNLPDPQVISAYVCSELSSSRLKGQKVLVTAGSTPTYIDDVRFISNKFRGALGIMIAEELCLRGADVTLVLGANSLEPSKFVNTTAVKDFEEYRSVVTELASTNQFKFGVFSAAVADYRASERVTGKIPSKGLSAISLEPTEKVIQAVRSKSTSMHMITFKFQLNISHDELMDIANNRLKMGYQAVLANRGEELSEDGGQIGHLVLQDGSTKTFGSKKDIALGIVDYMETV